jgi:drug/metabolite transporter (DMT)-like permease
MTIYTALVLVQILFGINYVVSQVILQAFPPLVWAGLRIIVAAATMLVVAMIWKPQSRPKLNREILKPLFIYTLLGTIINQTAFLKGLQYTTSTNSAILNTLIPVFTLLFVTFRGLEPLTLKRGIGFFLAFGGVLVMRKIEDFSLGDKTLQGDLLTILNCVSYGLFLSYSREFLKKYDRLWITAYMFLFGSIGINLMSLGEWTNFQWPTITSALAGAMAFSIIGGTLITYFLNNWTLSYSTSSSVAIFIYLQPIVAASLAWFWFGQVVTLRIVIASLIILLGVLLVLGVIGTRKSKTASPLPMENKRKVS